MGLIPGLGPELLSGGVEGQGTAMASDLILVEADGKWQFLVGSLYRNIKMSCAIATFTL